MEKYNNKGFTLIEILVALAILGIVLAAVYEVYLSSYKTSQVQEQVVDTQQNVRVAIDQIVRELQMAGYDPNAPGGVSAILGPVNVSNQLIDSTNNPNSTTTSIRFQGDIDNNGIRETIAYDLADTGTDNPYLRRTVDEDSNGTIDSQTRIASNIDGLDFTFYDNSNLLTTTPGNVRRITVTVKGRTERRDPNWTTGSNFVSGQGSFRTRTLASDVVLRNTGLTAGDTTPPLCPAITNVQATANCGVLRVSWNKPADIYGDLEGYYIYYDTNPIPSVAPNSLPSTVRFVNVLDQTLSQYDVSGLTNGTPYYIAMSSYDRSGNFCSPVAVFGGPVTPNDTTTPKAPDGFNATPGENQVTLKWNSVTKNTDNSDATDLKGYRVYRSTSSDMSGAILLADENALTISNTTAGRVEDTSYTDNATYSGANAPQNCTTYYYHISVVDTCNTASGYSSIVSATPPDNNVAPQPPTITSLYAGDDTSAIILSWSSPPSDPNYSDPVGYKVYYKKTSATTWILWLDITDLSTTSTIINGLSTFTSYDVRVSAYDSAAQCNTEAFSTIQSVSTADCAPRVNPPYGGAYIYKGINAQGTPLPNFSKVGTGPGALPDSKNITWVADPVDCSPDSSTFDRKGFDYNNPPLYTTVSPNAKVVFSIDSSLAESVYGTSRSSINPDTAPRNTQGYVEFYEFFDNTHPTSSLNWSLDTTRLCNGRHEFKALAIDGENYNATNIIPIDVDNGGINIDSSASVTSGITTPDDYHNRVRFGLENTNADKDLKITKIKLSWTNTSVNLKKMEVFDSNNLLVGLFEDTILPIDTISGTEVTLTTVPTVFRSGASGDRVTVRLTFTDSNGTVTSNLLDMREEAVTINSVTVTDPLDSNFVCTAGSSSIPLGTISIPLGPVISSNDTVQDKPNPDTLSQTTPGIVVQPGNNVDISTFVTPQSGTTISSVRLYWKSDISSSSTAPARPSTTGGGGNYSNTVIGSYDSTTLKWSGIIPSGSFGDSRIWYYLESIDSNGNFDIHPDSGAFTYAQCGTSPPTVSIVSPIGVANNITTVAASVSSNIDIKTVQFTAVRQSDGAIFAGPITMTFNSSTGHYEGQYNAGTSIKHFIIVTATDVCGNTTSEKSDLIN